MTKPGPQRSSHGLSTHNLDSQTLTSEHGNDHPDQQRQGSSKHERFAIQRALGFKNVVIYILLFLNMALITRMFSTYHRAPSKHCRGHASQPDQFTVWALPEHEHEGEDATSIDFWIKMGLIVALVMIGGIFAGMIYGILLQRRWFCIGD